MVTWALKEWNAAVIALLQGQTVLLLRKGGIREDRGQFRMAARQVLLLPTYEHQNALLLKPEYRQLLGHSEQVSDGKTVRFAGWAEITHVLPLNPPSLAYNLLPYLIWNRQFVEERLRWKPENPLYAMVLRAYRFKSSVQRPRHSGYGGCRSWVELGPAVEIAGSNPVLADGAYQQIVESIMAPLPDPVSM
jgi:hypothetical protein